METQEQLLKRKYIQDINNLLLQKGDLFTSDVTKNHITLLIRRKLQQLKELELNYPD